MNPCTQCGSTDNVSILVFGVRIVGEYCPRCQQAYMSSPEYRQMLAAALAEIDSDVPPGDMARAMTRFLRAVDTAEPGHTTEDIKRLMSEPPAGD